MKHTLLAAAASAAPMVLGSRFPASNKFINTTALGMVLPPLVARYTGECEPLCEQFRSRNDCVSEGYQNNCYDACLASCFMINDGAGTESPSESDLIIIMSEDSDWQTPDVGLRDNTSGDERTEIPCMGWCKRNNSTDAETAAQVNNMLDRVTAYGQIYHHLRGVQKPADATRIAVPIGTRLDPYLKSWVAGFKDRLVKGEELEEWHNSLFRHVEQSEGAAGSAWAYRFELVAHKDSEKELGELVQGLRGQQRRAVVKAVHKLWKEEFGRVDRA
ncbi:hypothetical protein SVAN01_10193 [Stagonosporopsis vannaccii]|nr:hypothetical protein SVAN01_10193 [Stagonosporopsis vannaccii]